jgi:hypothetical protein
MRTTSGTSRRDGNDEGSDAATMRNTAKGETEDSQDLAQPGLGPA